MQATFHIAMVSHQEISLDNLGSYALQVSENQTLEDRLSDLKEALAAEELYYLSTCNRTLFLICRKQELSLPELSLLFSGQDLAPIGQYSGLAAVQHLFEVASSMHSLVVGEREIIKQIRDAYRDQLPWGMTGDRVRLLIEQTVRAAKKVYADTRIGEKPVSVVSLAVKKLMQHNLPKSAKFLLVGAGDTIQLVLKHLTKKGYKNFTIYNRTADHAQVLAKNLNCNGYDLKQLNQHPDQIDCLIACTGAQDPTVRKETLPDHVLRQIHETVWIDLGLPADIDKVIGDEAVQNYIGLSSLRSLSIENMAFRKKEVSQAEIIISEKLREFRQLLELRNIEVAFQKIPTKIKSVKEKAIQEVFAKDLESLDPDTMQVINKMMDYMEKKCISIPMKVAKEVALKN